MTNAWRAEGSRDARHTEAKMAAFREMALDTLKEEVSMEKFMKVGGLLLTIVMVLH